MGQSGLLSVFVNKVLLVHSHALLLTYHLWLLSSSLPVVAMEQSRGPQSLNIYIWLLEFDDPWPRPKEMSSTVEETGQTSPPNSSKGPFL